MITIETDYALELLSSKSSFVQIYFEAVANAFDAGADEITIRILSDGKISPIGQLEVTISDNGEGFTDERFERFCVVKRPKDTHHKGLGRLVYLNYFSSVNVSSRFDGQKRTFSFSKEFNGHSDPSSTVESANLTSLHFTGFTGERLKSYDDINAGSLREQIIQQFLPMLLSKKKDNEGFKITIELQTESANGEKEFLPDEQVIEASDIPEFTTKTIQIQEDGTFQEPGMNNSYEVDMSYLVEQKQGNPRLFVAACIDGRTVPFTQFPLDSAMLPPDYSVTFLLTSEAFGISDTTRQKLELPKGITSEQLNRVLRREVSAVLDEEISAIRDKNKVTEKQLEEFYPHLTGYFEERSVGIINKDDAIEVARRRFFRDQKKVLESESLDEATFEKSLEVSSRTLTEYILYREKIIKRLADMTEKDPERNIHNLIVPRYKKFSQGTFSEEIYNNNAWLLDDKFMSFRTILSEARMREIISAITLENETVDDDSRPDIAMIFSDDPSGAQTEPVEVVIVEAKRKTDDKKENVHAITQLLDRATKLAEHCPNIQRIWYYALIQINSTMGKRLVQTKWAPLFSKGKVYYQEFPTERHDGSNMLTPVFVMSFDAIVKDAKTRNHTFLEILKNDIRQIKQPS